MSRRRICPVCEALAIDEIQIRIFKAFRATVGPGPAAPSGPLELSADERRAIRAEHDRRRS